MPRQNKARVLYAAQYAALASRAVTPQAGNLIRDISRELCEQERRRKARAYRRTPKALQRLQAAVEGFVGDLLLAQTNAAAQGWIYRSIRPQSFTGQEIGYRDFTAMRQGLEGLGMVVRKRFRRTLVRSVTRRDPNSPLCGIGTRFRATPVLLERSKQHGLRITNLTDHFSVDLERSLPGSEKSANARSKSSARRLNFGGKVICGCR